MSEEFNEKKFQANERLQEVLVALELTQLQFAVVTDINYNSLINASRLQRGLSEALFVAVKNKYPAINLNWLIAGEGEMWLDGTINKNSNAAKQIAEANSKIAALEAKIAEQNSKIEWQERELLLLRNSLQDKELIIKLQQKSAE